MDNQETLESRLARLREGARERIPEVMRLTDRMIEQLDREKIIHALGVGDRAPDFTLGRAGSDEPVRLGEQLEHGPAILSFYRGRW